MASKSGPPVTFISCAAGSDIDRTRLLRTLSEALHPGDEAFAVDANYGPVPSASVETCPPGVSLVRLPDVTRAFAYDRLAQESAHEHLIFVGTGCTLARADMERLRGRLVSAPDSVVVLTPSPTGASVALDARAVIGVRRHVLRAVGGLAATEDRARRVGAGFVGSGELFEVFVHEVRRAGWPVEQVRQQAAPTIGKRPPPGPAADARRRRDGTDRCDAVGRHADGSDTTLGVGVGIAPTAPSYRIPPELGAALSPTAAATIRWFSPFLPAAQVDALHALVGPLESGPGSGPGPIGSNAPAGWDALAVARMLWWRGQRPYAAEILDGSDLGGYNEPQEISEIALILSAAGRPLSTLVQSLAHAQPQLVAVLAAQPVDQALRALAEWWELEPGAEAVRLGVLALGPTLPLADAVAWHVRLREARVRCSPLVLVARSAERQATDRAVAFRCLQIDTPDLAESTLSELVAAHDVSARDAIDRMAQELLARTPAAVRPG